MIEIQNVTKAYGDKVAVNNLSATLKPGTITGFIGPNGAGKSTTLRMLTGITPMDSGRILINGHDIEREPIAAKREFGFISDNPDIFVALKGIEYVNFVCNIYEVPENERKERLSELLRIFEMEDAISQRIDSYSHGMRQKIHIIATLMHDPNIWIMDEPLTGLDPQSSFLLKEKMRAHAKEGNIVLFSTHVLEVAERLCDQIIIIQKGNITYTGTLEALKERYPERTLEEIFLSLTGSSAYREEA